MPCTINVKDIGWGTLKAPLCRSMEVSLQFEHELPESSLGSKTKVLEKMCLKTLNAVITIKSGSWREILSRLSLDHFNYQRVWQRKVNKLSISLLFWTFKAPRFGWKKVVPLKRFYWLYFKTYKIYKAYKAYYKAYKNHTLQLCYKILYIIYYTYREKHTVRF